MCLAPALSAPPACWSGLPLVSPSAPGGAVVIDNSSAFRYEASVPLVIPEINGRLTKTARLVANPNYTTAIGLMALAPLHKLFKMKRVIMSTYQVSN